MMNDFKLLYLCSRNHNESGCGSFFVHIGSTSSKQFKRKQVWKTR